MTEAEPTIEQELTLLDLISLMQHLEENRFILIVEGPQLPQFCLYFNGESKFYYRDDLYEHLINHKEDLNCYEFPLSDNSRLRITERLSGGTRNWINTSINLSDGNSLSEAGYGSNLAGPL